MHCSFTILFFSALFHVSEHALYLVCLSRSFFSPKRKKQKQQEQKWKKTKTPLVGSSGLKGRTHDVISDANVLIYFYVKKNVYLLTWWTRRNLCIFERLNETSWILACLLNTSTLVHVHSSSSLLWSLSSAVMKNSSQGEVSSSFCCHMKCRFLSKLLYLLDCLCYCWIWTFFWQEKLIVKTKIWMF